MNPYPRLEPRVVNVRGHIRPNSLDADAVRVVERLQDAGYEAYLVGGCVRDLLLGRAPKDFDVATSARPRQVRRIFRNCRIIGRRFKLAHVVFRRPDGTEHIVETATFRRAPQPQDEDPDELLILDDNTFGTAAEDAARRDFTINALFFDPRTWSVIDFVGGLDDLQKSRIETIGDPNIRLREDPVRILRAIKFAARLNFKIAFDTYDAMVRHALDLNRSATPRLLEEVLRLLRSGCAAASFQLLHQCGALAVVLPEIGEYLQIEATQAARGKFFIDLFWRDLRALDAAVASGDPVTPAFLEALLYYRIFEREMDPRRRLANFPLRDPIDAAEVAFDSLGRRMRISKFDIGRAKQICVAQTRFFVKPNKKFRVGSFVEQDYFQESLSLLRIHCVALEGLADNKKLWETYEGWYNLHKRKSAGPRRGREQATYFEAPAGEPTFEELWQLPTKQSAGENVNITNPPAPAAPPPEPEPAAEPEPITATTLTIASAMAPKFMNRDPDGPPIELPSAPRNARETLKYKINRPDAKFEFPERPLLTIDESPDFGDW